MFWAAWGCSDVERRVVWRCHYRRRFWRVEATLKFLAFGAFWTIVSIV
jgi:hypothetical protein